MSALPNRIASRHQRMLPEKALPNAESHLRLVLSGPTINRLPKQVYRQRRLLAVALAAIIAVGGFGLVHAGGSLLNGPGSPAGPAGAPMVPAASHTWTVQTGDTLWSIATKSSPTGKDVRPIVQQLSRERAGRPLQVGETISL